jgi:hypothetical protein
MAKLVPLAMALLLVQHHDTAGQFGTVRFANSCTAAVQPSFTRAMALLHSFEFGPAIDAFKAVHDADPGCAIALWGIGLAQWGNPFSLGVRPAAQLQAGRATAQGAASAGAKTERERDYIAALGALYASFETVAQHARVVAYRDAMDRVAAKYPDDSEAATFYALALAAAADPTDKTYKDQLKAGAMLETLWAAHPDHPGLAHYIIHSYDIPALAPRAIEAARRYAAIAPDSPHALHMPSHTFTRLGYWDDSIETNVRSAAAAHKAGVTYEELHATDYEVYAYLQTGRDADARRLLDGVAAIAAGAGARAGGGAANASAGAYAVAAIPARYALERGAWAEAEHLDVHRGAYAYTEAITWFARALGAARSRDLGLAKDAVDQLQKAIDRLTAEKEMYWTEQVSIQKLGASAWIALAEDRTDEALAMMREAADREDRTDKAAITPGPLAPARELLGEMLLQLNRPKDALVEFRKTMVKEPNRFRGLAGAARAAAEAGDRATARAYYTQLVKICQKADTPGRPELQAARAATR